MAQKKDALRHFPFACAKTLLWLFTRTSLRDRAATLIAILDHCIKIDPSENCQVMTAA